MQAEAVPASSLSVDYVVSTLISIPSKTIALIQAIFYAVIALPGTAWRACQSAKQWIQHGIACCVVPALAMGEYDWGWVHGQAIVSGFRQAALWGLNASETTYSPVPEVSLNGVKIIHTTPSATPPATPLAVPAERQKWVVYFLPNAALWEHMLPVLLEISKKTQANVLCYNYRGAGFSSGVVLSPQDLICDGVDTVNSLLAQGVRMEDITLHGFSLGGGVATQVAKRFADQNRAVNLVNERSFASIPEFLQSTLPVIIGHLAGWIVWLVGWELNSQQALTHLRGHVLAISMAHDPISTFGRAARTTATQAQMQYLDMQHGQNDGNPHCRPWKPAEWNQYVSRMQSFAA